jgi:hypothetical protein
LIDPVLPGPVLFGAALSGARLSGAALSTPLMAGTAPSPATGSEFLARVAAATEEVSTGTCASVDEPLDDREPADFAFGAVDRASPELRTADRGPRVVLVLDGADDESLPADDSVELEPAEPVVSANAIGSAPIPEPTPRATANAPTRPMYRA